MVSLIKVICWNGGWFRTQEQSYGSLNTLSETQRRVVWHPSTADRTTTDTRNQPKHRCCLDHITTRWLEDGAEELNDLRARRSVFKMASLMLHPTQAFHTRMGVQIPGGDPMKDPLINAVVNCLYLGKDPTPVQYKLLSRANLIWRHKETPSNAGGSTNTKHQ